jgi:hypothetical protein
MVSIVEVGFVDQRRASRVGPLHRLRVLYRLARRTGRRQRWQMAMLRELHDPRLLADIGVNAGTDFSSILALARAIGGTVESRR